MYPLGWAEPPFNNANLSLQDVTNLWHFREEPYLELRQWYTLQNTYMFIDKGILPVSEFSPRWLSCKQDHGNMNSIRAHLDMALAVTLYSFNPCSMLREF